MVPGLGEEQEHMVQVLVRDRQVQVMGKMGVLGSIPEQVPRLGSGMSMDLAEGVRSVLHIRILEQNMPIKIQMKEHC